MKTEQWLPEIRDDRREEGVAGTIKGKPEGSLW